MAARRKIDPTAHASSDQELAVLSIVQSVLCLDYLPTSLGDPRLDLSPEERGRLVLIRDSLIPAKGTSVLEVTMRLCRLEADVRAAVPRLL